MALLCKKYQVIKSTYPAESPHLQVLGQGPAGKQLLEVQQPLVPTPRRCGSPGSSARVSSRTLGAVGLFQLGLTQPSGW